MSPRKSEEVVMINFCQSSRSQMFFKTDVLKNFANFTEKKTVLESLLNKFPVLKGCNFIKKRLQHRCFPVKFHKFLRGPFLQNASSGWKGSVKELT